MVQKINSLKNKFKSIKLDTPVVDSQGPATAIAFGLKILSRLTDDEKADEIRKKVLA
jgi:hypothetical protein